MTSRDEQQRIAAVLVLANADVTECLTSFSSITYRCCTVIVVHDSSKDQAVQGLRSRFPFITALSTKKCRGLYAAQNLGIQEALRRGAEFVFLAAAEGSMTPTVLDEMVRVMNSDQRIGICGAKCVWSENPSLTWMRYGRLTWGPLLVERIGYLQPNEPDVPTRDVDFVPLSGCMIRAAAFDRVGQLDERFSFLTGDVDWCTRARGAGLRVVHADRAIVHLHGKAGHESQEEPTSSYAYIQGRNAMLFARKHASTVQWAQLVPLMCGALAVRTLLHSIYEAIRAIAGQKAFILGLRDGMAGQLRRELITLRPAERVWTASRPPLARLLHWIGL